MAVSISGVGVIEGITSFNGGGFNFRNILYNGWVNTSDEINQRDKTFSEVSNGEYWADRWERVTSSTMTQKVEEGNYIPNETYTLSGTNVTTTQVTSPSSGTWDWGTVPSDASLVQLELGDTATSFEYRPKGLELALCQRYYQRLLGYFESTKASPAVTKTSSLSVRTTTTMRVVPTVTYYDYISNANRITSTIDSVRYNSLIPSVVVIERESLFIFYQDSINISSIVITEVIFNAEL